MLLVLNLVLFKTVSQSLMLWCYNATSSCWFTSWNANVHSSLHEALYDIFFRTLMILIIRIWYTDQKKVRGMLFLRSKSFYLIENECYKLCGGRDLEFREKKWKLNKNKANKWAENTSKSLLWYKLQHIKHSFEVPNNLINKYRYVKNARHLTAETPKSA